MKKSMNSGALIALLALGAGLAPARGAVTNVAMVTQFALTGVRQAASSTATPVRMSNKDILAALNATGRFDFASNAQLLLLSYEGNLPNFAVRQGNGTNASTTDISRYFYITEPTEVHSAGFTAGYAIYVFHFDNRVGTSFNLSGMTTLHAGTITGPGIGPLYRDKTLTSSVNGGGTFNGDSVVLHGTVTGGSAKAEID